MARPIDADWVLEALNSIISDYTSNGIYPDGFGIDDAINLVEDAPTYDPQNEPLTLDSRITPKMVTCPKGWKGVRDTRFYCPGCKKAVKKGEAYCHKCGQALIFPVQRYDKENNRIWLDFDRRPPEGEEDG